MKTLSTLLLLFVLSTAKAQIGNVKETNGSLDIINENGIYEGYINMSNGDYLAGFNNQYVVVVKNNEATIYDIKGKYVNDIRLCSDCKVKNVTSTNILISEGSRTLRYDFKGRYLGEL
jgi:hypothetical protein